MNLTFINNDNPKEKEINQNFETSWLKILLEDLNLTL